MEKIIPAKLAAGDEIRVIAPATLPFILTAVRLGA